MLALCLSQKPKTRPHIYTTPTPTQTLAERILAEICELGPLTPETVKAVLEKISGSLNVELKKLINANDAAEGAIDRVLTTLGSDVMNPLFLLRTPTR